MEAFLAHVAGHPRRTRCRCPPIRESCARRPQWILITCRRYWIPCIFMVNADTKVSIYVWNKLKFGNLIWFVGFGDGDANRNDDGSAASDAANSGARADDARSEQYLSGGHSAVRSLDPSSSRRHPRVPPSPTWLPSQYQHAPDYSESADA